MRLFKPAGDMPNKNNLFKTLGALVLVIVLANIIGIYWRHHNASKISATNTDANDLQIQRFKNSNDTTNKRILISAYEGKNDYKSALPLAQQIANQTKTYQDYMAVLNICALHNVSNKDDCLNIVVVNLKTLVAQMPFSSAYAAGALLEKSNRSKDAVVFYQRAYDVYAPDPKAENMMSQEQLKSHIDELQK